MDELAIIDKGVMVLLEGRNCSGHLRLLKGELYESWVGLNIFCDRPDGHLGPHRAWSWRFQRHFRWFTIL